MPGSPGEKGTVWGTVIFDANIYGRRAINASSAFAPGDVRPLIALPQIPCSDVPVPGNHIAVNHSEVTLHGELVWRGGRLWLATPRGNVRLELPRPIIDQDGDFECFAFLEMNEDKNYFDHQIVVLAVPKGYLPKFSRQPDLPFYYEPSNIVVVRGE